VNSLGSIQMVQNYKLSCKLTYRTEKTLQISYMTADMKLAVAVDKNHKIVVNAQWHVQGLGNITSIIW
jgi:hypothetical protein